MDNGQIYPTSPASGPKRKRIALAVGGAVALLGCAALLVALGLSVACPSLQKTGSVVAFACPGGLETASPSGTSAPTAVGPAFEQSGNTIGDPNAPVKIVEYADFQCPFCKLYWQDTEQQIIANYVKTGKVYYEYRTVGGYLGEESQAAAEAAYCAAEQGKFWDYHDALFSRWTGENVGDFTPEKLKQYAASVGLDQVAFEQCLSSGKMTARVQQDLDNARRDGIKGTPSFIINDTVIEGAQPFTVFQQAIEQALQGK